MEGGELFQLLWIFQPQPPAQPRAATPESNPWISFGLKLNVEKVRNSGSKTLEMVLISLRSDGHVHGQ